MELTMHGILRLLLLSHIATTAGEVYHAVLRCNGVGCGCTVGSLTVDLAAQSVHPSNSRSAMFDLTWHGPGGSGVPTNIMLGYGGVHDPTMIYDLNFEHRGSGLASGTMILTSLSSNVTATIVLPDTNLVGVLQPIDTALFPVAQGMFAATFGCPSDTVVSVRIAVPFSMNLTQWPIIVQSADGSNVSLVSERAAITAGNISRSLAGMTFAFGDSMGYGAVNIAEIMNHSMASNSPVLWFSAAGELSNALPIHFLPTRWTATSGGLSITVDINLDGTLGYRGIIPVPTCAMHPSPHSIAIHFDEPSVAPLFLNSMYDSSVQGTVAGLSVSVLSQMFSNATTVVLESSDGSNSSVSLTKVGAAGVPTFNVSDDADLELRYAAIAVPTSSAFSGIARAQLELRGLRLHFVVYWNTRQNISAIRIGSNRIVHSDSSITSARGFVDIVTFEAAHNLESTELTLESSGVDAFTGLIVLPQTGVVEYVHFGHAVLGALLVPTSSGFTPNRYGVLTMSPGHSGFNFLFSMSASLWNASLQFYNTSDNTVFLQKDISDRYTASGHVELPDIPLRGLTRKQLTVSVLVNNSTFVLGTILPLEVAYMALLVPSNSPLDQSPNNQLPLGGGFASMRIRASSLVEFHAEVAQLEFPVGTASRLVTPNEVVDIQFEKPPSKSSLGNSRGFSGQGTLRTPLNARISSLHVGAVWQVVISTTGGDEFIGIMKWIRLIDSGTDGTVLIDNSHNSTGSSVTLVLPTENGLSSESWIGASQIHINSETQVLSYSVFLQRFDGRQCEPSLIDFGIHFDALLLHTVSSLGGFGTGNWSIANDVDDNRTDTISAVARGDVFIRVFASLTSSDNESIAVSVGRINENSLFVASQRNIFMTETARPGSRIFRNAPDRPYVFTLGPLRYESLSELFVFETNPAQSGIAILRDSGYRFDYELETELIIQIQVTDTVSGRSERAAVKITLVDVNNKPPRFLQRTYTAEVLEGIPVQSLILTIRAYDGDPAFPELSYVWQTSGQTSTRVAGTADAAQYLNLTTDIEQDNNGRPIYVGRITTARNLSRTSVQKLSGLASVTDGSNGGDVAVVHVNVIDINDNPPIFGPPSINITCTGQGSTVCSEWTGASFREDVAINTVLYDFSATDADIGRNGHVYFRLVSGVSDHNCSDSIGLFKVVTLAQSASSPQVFRGRLLVQRRLDFETAFEHTVCVEAIDAGAPPKISVLALHVQVTDVPFGLEIASTNLQHLPDTDILGTASDTVRILFVANGEDRIDSVQFELIFGSDKNWCDPAPTSSCEFFASGLGDGFYNVTVRAWLMNISLAELSVQFLVDTDAPLGFLVDAPGINCIFSGECGVDSDLPHVNQSDIVVALMHHNSVDCDVNDCQSVSNIRNSCEPCQTGSAVTFLCRVDGFDWTAFEPCPVVTNITYAYPLGTTILQFDGMSDGIHTLQVKLIDELKNNAFNDSVQPLEYKWIVDTASPTGMITRWPKRASANATAYFEIFSNDSNASFSCELDGFVQPCTGHPVSGFAAARYADLSHGEHTFRAIISDDAGNLDVENVPTYSWIVDRRAPTVRIDSLPPVGASAFWFPFGGMMSSNVWNVHFSADERVSHYECRLTKMSFPQRHKCCEMAFSHLLPDCVSPCIEDTVATTCTETSNTTVYARRIYSECATLALRDLYKNLSVDGAWDTCTSPLLLSDLTDFSVYVLEIIATDVRGNTQSRDNATKWFWGVDKLYMDRPTERAVLEVNAAIEADGTCDAINTALVVVCVVSWALLLLVIGVLAITLYTYQPPTLGEVKAAIAEQISYDDAMAMMGMQETSLDSILHTEPGYLDSFGMSKFNEADEASTDPVVVPSLNPMVAAKMIANVPEAAPTHSHTLEVSSDPSGPLHTLHYQPQDIPGQQTQTGDSDEDRDEDMGFGDLASSDEEDVTSF